MLGSQITTHKGFAFKSGWYTPAGTPIVKVSDFTENSIDTASLTFIPTELAAAFSRYRLEEGDVVIQTVGSWPSNPQSVVGKVVRVPRRASGALLNQNAVIVQPKPPLDKRFLFYLLRSPLFKHYIIGTAQGAASQASITLDSIRGFCFKLPSAPVQRRIATILSAYDDLIENSTRRITILEEMAQAIYREWFVHFRFPGHEKVKMFTSKQGPLPQTWSVQRVRELVKRLKAGRVYTDSDVVDEGNVPVIDQSRTSLLGYHDNAPDFWATPSNPIVVFGDHTCKMQLMVEPFSVGPNVVPFVSNTKLPILYLFFVIRNLVETKEYKRHWTELTNKAVILGAREVAEEFARSTTTILEEINLLMHKNENLRRSRDLLLPKLIAGEIPLKKPGH